jgi:hypothetical protein
MEKIVSFHQITTLAGYARAAVDLRVRMAEYVGGPLDLDYLHTMLAAQLATTAPELDEPAVAPAVEAVTRAAKAAWTVGETFVLAPAMTAIVAAAAEALDLTGDLLTADVAPTDHGVLFLPEPVYSRRPTGTLAAIGAITWATISSGNRRSWLIGSWSPLHDPDDPNAAAIRRNLDTVPALRGQFGPYLLNNLAQLPIASPVHAEPDSAPVDEADRDWQNAPDGRYVILDEGRPTRAVTALLYAFWRIQAQPLAVAARPPVNRSTRRRAQRASVHHDTRVVMLRRTSPVAEPGDGEAKWHYRVRFVVRGHWRRLVDKHGRQYRIWIHAHIKGPDGAPLMHGEKVAVLAR